MIHNGIAVVIGTSRSLDTISPPRSSRIGIIEMINTTASLDTYFPNVTANAAANFSIISSVCCFQLFFTIYYKVCIVNMCPSARKLSRSANFLQSLVQRLHLALCADRNAQTVVDARLVPISDIYVIFF